jgi:hypothetical protein
MQGGIEASMTKSVLAVIAALTVASAIATTAAEAKDGCGKGMFFNGRSCVLKGDRGVRAFEPGIRDRGDRWDRRGDRWDHRADRYDRRDRGVSLGFGGLRVHLGDGKPKFGIDL